MGLSSNLERYWVAASLKLEKCATKLFCCTGSHAFHGGGGMIFVWKMLLADLSVSIILGNFDPHRCAVVYTTV